jgi:hypothetical protein
MREDMFKVIVERPRRGGYGGKKGRKQEYSRQDAIRASYDAENYDEPSSWEKIRPVGRGADRKDLNENLEPLWRFLQSCVGRCWDDVYSEIRANLSPKNAVQMHVVQHLKQQVTLDTYLGEDGCVYEHPKYGSRPTNLEEPVQYNYQFYVHPVTREFCQSPRKAKRRDKKDAAKDRFKRTDLSWYRLINGIWYVVEFEKIPFWKGEKPRYYGGGPAKLYNATMREMDNRQDYSRVGDILHPEGLSNWQREAEYGFTNIYAVSKRQLGKRELRHIKTLLNPA